MKYILIFIQYLLPSSSYCQDTIAYKYVVKNPIIFDTVTHAYLDMNLEFSTERIYYNRNVYKEARLFSKTDNSLTTSTFKKVFDQWYLQDHKGNWLLFYCKQCKHLPKTKILVDGKNYLINWGHKERIDTLESQIFTLQPQGFLSSSATKYFFNDVLGIIAVGVEDAILVRNDIVKSNPYSF